MFQFRGFPPHSYVFTVRCYGIAVTGFPIRISAGLWIFAPNRSFSQLVTSFFGSWCQVILPTLFIAWPLTWFELLRIRDFLLMLLKFFTLSYILIYFGKTFPHFLCLIIFIYYPWVCIYFIKVNISSLLLSIIVLHCSVFKVQNFVEYFSLIISKQWVYLEQIFVRNEFFRRCRVRVYAKPRKNLFSGKKMSKWWRWGGSNSWPPACKAGALPAELHPHFRCSGFYSPVSCLPLIKKLTNINFS